MKLII